MLYIIGLGLGDERDITLRGLDAVRSSDKVYLESYTSLLGVDKSALEKLYNKKIIVADREFVEENADDMINYAAHSTVSFLVVGDPFGATTHTDLWLRARRREINIQVIHNASILTAITSCGLQSYRFGETISLVFFTPTWRPSSFYDKIEKNRLNNLHTLCLLDLKIKEPTEESLLRGYQGQKKKYMEPKFMTISDAIEQLLQVEHLKKRNVYNEKDLVIGLARIGTKHEKIVAGEMEKLKFIDFGLPLHSLIIPARELHFHEQQVLNEFRNIHSRETNS